MTIRGGSLGFVDPACPVEWSHPLNAGLVGSWLSVPNAGWRGGLAARDAVRGGRYPHDGVLTSSPSWVGGGRATPALAVSGSAHVKVAGPPAFNPHNNSFGFGLWAMTTATGATQSVMSFTASTEGSPASVALGQRAGGAWRAEGYGANTAPNLVGTTTPAAGVWYHVFYTWDGTTGRLYVNGVQENSNATVPQDFAMAFLWLGRFSNDYDQWSGSLSDARQYGYAPPAARVMQLYQQSRWGNPDLLRWVTPRTYFGTQAEAAAGVVGKITAVSQAVKMAAYY